MFPTLVSLSSFLDWKSNDAMVAAWYWRFSFKYTVVPNASSWPHIPRPVLLDAPLVYRPVGAKIV